MPTYMDRHDVAGVSPDQLTEAHEMDMAMQEAHDVKVLTYWFDQQAGLAFCLVEAPSSEALLELHQASHGLIPGEVEEVDLDEVRAYLGRTSDPEPDDSAGTVQTSALVDGAFRAIMFTDLKDSTAMSLNMGDQRAFEILTVHDDITRQIVARFDGRVVKHTGDGFMVSFMSVANGVKAAIALQQALADHNRQHANMPIHIRVGLNAGMPIEHSGDLFGTTVQLSARAMAQAQPDQILVTGIMRELCEDPELLSKYQDAGRATLKGFISAVQLYKIDW